TQAAVHGHDATGRFHTFADWLRHPQRDPGLLTQFGLASTLSETEWTIWEPLATADEPALVVVREDLGLLLGLALAAGLGLLVWRGRDTVSRGWRFRLLLIWLAVGGLALIWLPTALHAAAWWPVLLGIVLAVGWYLGWQVKPAASPSKK